MEVVATTLGLSLLAPMLLAVAVLVKVSGPGPVLFRQRRVGHHGRLFELLKFRSMTHEPQVRGPQVTTACDARVTRVGRFLRRTKLDELPQLWNVLRGDMALVGPRPEVPCYVERYPQLFSLVLQRRPGITDVCTLHLRQEEQVLAAAGGDPERYYIETLLPRKLGASIREGLYRSCWRDVRVLVATIIPWLAFLAPRADFRPLADLYTLPVANLGLAAQEHGSRVAVGRQQAGRVDLAESVKLGA